MKMSALLVTAGTIGLVLGVQSGPPGADSFGTFVGFFGLALIWAGWYRRGKE